MILLILRCLSLVILIFSGLAFSKESRNPQIEDRIRALEEAVEKLDVRLGLLNERSNVIAGRTQISYLDATYVKTGFHVLFPRGSTFNYPTDTGLGVFAGVGHYFGRNHVVDVSLDWDLFPAATVQYRYEWRNKDQTINIGPIVGVKTKLATQRPLDNYLDARENLKSIYGVVGVGAGFPVGLSLVQTEILAYFNRQLFIVGSLGLHFFL
jgi:hypothetical protein